MSDRELDELRACGEESFEYKVLNGLMDVDLILKALNNHILAVDPVVQKPAGGGFTKSTTTLPMLEEPISETAYQACMYRFDIYCVSCKLSNNEIKHRLFEAVPTMPADQICVDLEGNESKEEVLKKVKMPW